MIHQQILKEAKALMPQVIADRRHLHANPEYGMVLPKTLGYVRNRLEAMGYSVSDCGGGLITTCGQGGKVILLRADMDALHIDEDTNLPFCSRNGAGHMCGHDLHTSMLLGAAALLKKHEHELNGTVKFMFQPGEEVNQGANAMAADGLFENPKVDAAMAIHVMPTLENGHFQCCPGIASSSFDGFYIHIKGKGGHGSTPELATDPLFASVQMYNMLQGLVSRESNMFESCVCSIGVLGGGQMANVIPQDARLEGTVRCYNSKVRARVMQRLWEIVDHVCQMTGTTCDKRHVPVDSIYNDPDFLEQMRPWLTDILGNHFEEIHTPATFSEDFSVLSNHVPSLFLLMGVGEPGRPPLHNPNAVFEEDQMYKGLAVMAYGAIQWLSL